MWLGVSDEERRVKSGSMVYHARRERLFIRNRKNFEFYTAPEELPRGMRTSTAILNVGVLFTEWVMLPFLR